jgi:hypothetical protein
VTLTPFKEIDLKYRFSVVFAVIALILSGIIGLFAGNNIGLVVIRSMIMTIVFMILGYGVIFIIQKFVPEILGIVGSDEPLPSDEVQIDSEAVASEINGDEIVQEDAPDFGEDDSVPLVDSTLKKDYFNIGKEEEGKLGKHIIVDESKIKYEPKIMADAIRTMLKRDEK